jgi:hypothetical protein
MIENQRQQSESTSHFESESLESDRYSVEVMSLDEVGEELRDETELGVEEEEISLADIKEQIPFQHQLELYGNTILVSHAFDIGSSRDGVIISIEDEEGRRVVRPLYKSNSHGVWKTLPSYIRRGSGMHYDKSRGEDSVTVDFALQKVLSEIELNGITSNDNGENILCAAAPDMRTAESIPFEDYSADSGVVLGNVGSLEQGISSPEDIQVNDEMKPDFDAMVNSWKSVSSVYDEVEHQVFLSQNGQLEYMFCRGSHGEVWVGGVQVVESQMNSWGTKSEFVKTGDLTKPPIENIYNAGAYGSPEKTYLDDRYIDISERFQANLEVIREYKEFLDKGGEFREEFENISREMDVLSCNSFEELIGVVEDIGESGMIEDVKTKNVVRALYMLSEDLSGVVVEDFPSVFGIKDKVKDLVAQRDIRKSI